MKPLRRSAGLRLALAAAFSLGAGAAAQRLAQPGPHPADATVAEQYLLSAANQERGALGLGLLHRDPRLALAAAAHAREMARHASISHQFHGEAELSARGAGAGVRFSAISENVAEAPGAVQIHAMWMHSTAHRENLLDPAIDSAGISVVARAGQLYAVEDFARTVAPFSLAEQESAIAALIAQPGAMALAGGPDSVSAARQTCTMSAGYAGARKPWFVMRFTSDSLAVLPDQLKARLASGRFHEAAVGACAGAGKGPFTSYNIAVLLYP